MLLNIQNSFPSVQGTTLHNSGGNRRNCVEHKQNNKLVSGTGSLYTQSALAAFFDADSPLCSRAKSLVIKNLLSLFTLFYRVTKLGDFFATLFSPPLTVFREVFILI